MRRALFAMVIGGPLIVVIGCCVAGASVELARRAAARLVHWPRWEDAE